MSIRRIWSPARALLVGAALLLLAACGRGGESDEVSGASVTGIFLPVIVSNGTPAGQAPAAMPEAAQALEPPAEVALLPAPQAYDAVGAPVPPIPSSGGTTALLPIAVAAEPVEPAVPPLTEATGGEPFDWQASENYLVLGTDRRQDGGSWRTDSIMVVGLDRENERAAAFSIPRDLYVSIPGYGYGRINQADYMGERRSPDGGGPALVGDILEDLLGIRTDHWVRIQMDGFVEFVDALGGVSVYLDCAFSEPIFNLDSRRWEAFRLPAGENLLDGQDAYWFARLRYNETDIGRSRRQRALIWAMRDQILSTNAITRLPQLYTAFQETIDTDLGLVQIVNLARFALGIDAANVRAGGLTLRDLANYTTPAGAQVLVVRSLEHVRGLVSSIWEQPAMADAYRAEAAGCEAPAPIEATAAVDQAQQALPAGANVEQVAFASIVAPGLEQAAAAPSLTVEPTALAPLAGPSTTDLPPLFDPAIDQDPATGIVYDPITGFPFDPATGRWVDPATGLAVDVRALPEMAR